MRFNRLSYRILAVFILVVIVCLGVSGWVMLQISENIITGKISEGDQLLASRIAQDVEAEMANIKPTLILLAQTQGLRLMEATEVKVEIDRVQRGFPDITSMYVANVEGKQIARTGAEELEDVSQIWSFQVAVGGDELVSDIYLRSTTSEPMQTIALPIIDNGTVVGVLSADISFMRVMVSVMGIDVGENGNVLIVAANGRVIAHTQMEQLPELDLSESPVVEAVLAGQEGAMEGYTDELGRQVFGAYAPILELGWGVVIQKPLAAIDAEIWQLRSTILWAMLAAILLAVLAGWLMSRQITKPIRRLASASERVSQGDLSTPVNVKSSTELGVLANSFNQMMVSLRESRDELKRWGDELRESEESFRTLMEQSPLGIQIMTLDGRIVQVNDAYEKLWGITLDDLSEYNILQDEQARSLGMMPYIERGFAGEAVALPEFEYDAKKTVKKGRNPWVRSYIYPVKDENDEILNVIMIYEDVTERKKAEEELQKHREHLEELVKERTSDLEGKTVDLEQANIRLQEVDSLKSVFLASMSHELRTPLNSIIGFTGIILQGMSGEVNEEQKKQLTMVKNSADHLLSLINDILDISKIEAGKVELSLEEFNLDDVVREVVELLSPAAGKKGLELLPEVSEGITLTSDRRRIKQILVNLMSNGVKFTDQGSVKITARVSEGENLEMSVTDTGIGIKSEDMDKLFRPFQQIDMALNKSFEGTGLGLHLCRKLADLLGGDIRMESEYGKGSEFTLVLPLRYKGEQRNQV